MTLQTLPGTGSQLYDMVIQTAQNPGFLSTALIDASTEKIAIIGNVWHPTIKTGTINIRKVHFRTGAITFNALSTLRVSLQNVSATAGPPYQPDGSQDQTYDFVGAGLASNTWTATGNLSADRAVDLSAVNVSDANSRWIAVVIEYQTFTAADSIIVSAINAQATPLNSGLGGQSALNTGAWALLNSAANIVALECDDGTFAFLSGAMPISAFSNASVASNGAIRAAGLKFSYPVEIKIDGIYLGMVAPNGCDGTLKLYDSDGTTELVSIEIDNDAVAASSLMRHTGGPCAPITLAANTFYRLAFVAGTTTAATVYYADVNAAGLMDGLAGGQNMHWTQRDSGGVWTDTTTRRPHFLLNISAVHDGSGGASGDTATGSKFNGGFN